MILNGFKLLISPKRAWPRMVSGQRRSALWLIAAAVTAAVLPAAAVVAGHLGSAVLGHTDHATATLRAAVGFIAVAGGAVVVAPAMTLSVLALAGQSRGNSSASGAENAAMAVVWPVWTTGMILCIPPLLGFGPELGELLWVLAGALIAYRTARAGSFEFLGVRRRWFGHFTVRTAATFTLLFGLVVLGPAMLVRDMLGAEGEFLPTLPERSPLPLPPKPNW